MEKKAGQAVNAGDQNQTTAQEATNASLLEAEKRLRVLEAKIDLLTQRISVLGVNSRNAAHKEIVFTEIYAYAKLKLQSKQIPVTEFARVVANLMSMVEEVPSEWFYQHREFTLQTWYDKVADTGKLKDMLADAIQRSEVASMSALDYA